jgi:hypothetical protein
VGAVVGGVGVAGLLVQPVAQRIAAQRKTMLTGGAASWQWLRISNLSREVHK